MLNKIHNIISYLKKKKKVLSRLLYYTMYYINTIWALINPEMVLKSRSLKKKKYKVTQKKKPLFENEKKKKIGIFEVFSEFIVLIIWSQFTENLDLTKPFQMLQIKLLFDQILRYEVIRCLHTHTHRKKN